MKHSNDLAKIVVIAAFLAALFSPLAARSRAQTIRGGSAPPPRADEQHLLETYGKLPLSFEANAGQTSNEVKFLSRGPGYTLFLTRRAEAVLESSAAAPQHVPEPQRSPGAAAVKVRTESTAGSVVRIRLVNAQITPQAEGLAELPGKANYFIGNDPKKWRTNVPMYGRVNFHAVYPGVDLAYYGNQRQLEYDFIVAPHADPGSITMVVEDAKMSLDPQGDLLLTVKNREVRLQSHLPTKLWMATVEKSRADISSRVRAKSLSR